MNGILRILVGLSGEIKKASWILCLIILDVKGIEIKF
jgi:hypothetical protein